MSLISDIFFERKDKFRKTNKLGLLRESHHIEGVMTVLQETAFYTLLRATDVWRILDERIRQDLEEKAFMLADNYGEARSILSIIDYCLSIGVNPDSIFCYLPELINLSYQLRSIELSAVVLKTKLEQQEELNVVIR